MSAEEQQPTPVGLAMVPRYAVTAPVCRRSVEEPAATSLLFLVFPAGSELAGRALLLCVFPDLSRSPSTNPKNWVKLPKLCACHGIPAPYRSAFAVLKG